LISQPAKISQSQINLIEKYPFRYNICKSIHKEKSLVNEILEETEMEMEESIEALKKKFATVRTGKVKISILDPVLVEYYGTKTKLNQVATVLAVDATTITITPWEKNLLSEIEKAIQAENLGVNPMNDGEQIKLFFPPMTTEQREQSVKQAKSMAESIKVAIRNHRKNANNKIKRLEKDKEISEDESKRAQDQVQKLTDKYIAKVDELFENKKNEIMKI
jgi:ribosome recycling factor